MADPWGEWRPPTLRRVVLIDKMTRWEALCGEARDDKEIDRMKRQFPGMFETYKAHTAAIHHILDVLTNRHQVVLEVVKAQKGRPVSLSNVDAIISAGGDGTFLEAASLITWSPVRCTLSDSSPNATCCFSPAHPDKQPLWVFGINTDPARSEGRLLLRTPCTDNDEDFDDCSPNSAGCPRKPQVPRFNADNSAPPSPSLRRTLSRPICQRTKDCLTHAIDKIARGTYSPVCRRRIRVTIVNTGDTSDRPPGVQYRQDTITRRQSTTPSNLSVEETLPFPSAKSSPGFPLVLDSGDENPSNDAARLLDYRAVNDVLVTPKESHVSMYVEFSVDGGAPQRSKNSGVIVCTGSGSSAWAFNASKVSEDLVKGIINQFIQTQPQSVRDNLVLPDTKALCQTVNSSLLFDPSKSQMRFVIREPIDNRVFSTPTSSGFCRVITLRPLNAEVCISLDGLSLVPVKFGQTVVLEIGHEEDVLLTGR